MVLNGVICTYVMEAKRVDSPGKKPVTVTRRPVRSEDEAFLFELYSCIRAEELEAFGWSKDQRDIFLKMQFEAQQKFYRGEYPKVDQQVVFWKDQSIGRIIIIRADNEIRLADIAILPDFRNAGIGITLIQELLDEGKEAAQPVRLQVLKTNRAVRLYERLGFSIIDESSTHLLMERRPIGKEI